MINQHILIVDDDQVTLRLIEGILKNQGYEKLSLSNSGEQAMALIESAPPDLVLLDIFMPGIKGYDVCRMLKSNSSTAHIPIIMLTGGAVQADEAIEKSFAAGVNDFVTKPIQTIEFLARVKSALSGKMAHDRMTRELIIRKKVEAENNELIEKLRQSLLEIKSLQGILPICSCCKKIRDDQGYWKQLEDYIQTYSDAKFSHSICPDCLKKEYPDLNLE